MSRKPLQHGSSQEDCEPDSSLQALVDAGYIDLELLDRAKAENAVIEVAVSIKWHGEEGDRDKTDIPPQKGPLRPAAYEYPPEDFVTCANEGDPRAKELLQTLLKYGPTPELVDKLNAGIDGVRMGIEVRLNSENAEVAKDYIWLPDHPPTGDEGLILAFIEFLSSGAFRKLKVCAANDCENYHFRRGKWCSNTCGSRSRVQAMRKRNRGGNLESRYL